MEYTLSTLSPELFINILSYIDMKTLYNLCLTCKLYSTLSTSECDSLWNSLVNSLLKKPLKYTYVSIHHYNNINRTQYETWFQLYFNLVYILQNVTEVTFSNAIKNGHLELCRLISIPPALLDRQVIIFHREEISMYSKYVFASDMSISEPLNMACSIDCTDILSEVISYYNVHNHNIINHVLISACKHGSIKCVKYLLKHYGANPAYECNTPLIVAVFKSSVDIVIELLKHPEVDPSDQDNTAIRVALLYHSYQTQDNLKRISKLLLGDNRVKHKLIEWDSYRAYKDYLRFLLSNPHQAQPLLESTVEDSRIKWSFERILDVLL